MPKPSPIDTAAIARATRFDVTIFLGTGRYHTATFGALAEARTAAPLITAEVKNGRKAMIYAVSESRSVFVPDHYQPATQLNGADAMTTNLSNMQIVQLAAILTGGGFKCANSKEAAVSRFLKVAEESGALGHEAALNTLALDFDAARRVVEATRRGMEQANGAAPIVDDHSAKVIDATETGLGGKAAKLAAIKGEPKAPAEKPAKAPKAEKAAKPASKRAATIEAAQRGELPALPDFSAETHKRFRPKLARLVEMATAGDIAGLRATEINPVSSSPKAMLRCRDLALAALEARGT